MGWLFMDNLGGYLTPKAYLEDQYNFENEEGTSEILASAMLKMTTWYAACRQFNKKTGMTETFALVVLVKYNKRASDGMIFGYKDMAETAGPNESECPERILDMLGPTTNEYAQEWRARCRAAIALKRRPTPNAGDMIVFADSISFTDGSESRRFIVAREGRRTIFLHPSTRNRYRISRWKERAWTIITKIDVKLPAA